MCLPVAPRWVRPELKELKVQWIWGSGLGFVREVRRKRGIPLVGQILTSPSHWSVSDRSFVFHKAGHSSKAAIKSRTFSPIIPLTWTPTPNPADVPVSTFTFRVAHFRLVQLSKNTQKFTNTKTFPSVFKSMNQRVLFDVTKCYPFAWDVNLRTTSSLKNTNVLTSQIQKFDFSVHLHETAQKSPSVWWLPYRVVCHRGLAQKKELQLGMGCCCYPK